MFGRIDRNFTGSDGSFGVTRRTDVALFVGLTLLWGLSFPVIEVGLDYLPPLLFAALRYDVAAVVLLAYTAIRVDGRLPRGRDDILAVVAGGLFLVAGNGLLFLGQRTVPSGAAAIITSLIPLVTVLWAFVLVGERRSPLALVGVVLALVGTGLVVQPDPESLLAGDTVGRLLIVGQVVSVALGGVLVQRARPSLGTVPLTAWSMVLGALVLHLLSSGVGETPGAEATTPTAVAAVVYLGIFSTAIAFLIYFTILARHGAFEVTLIQYAVPVVATVVGVVVLGETIEPATIAGFGVIVLGFVAVKRRAISELLEGHTAPS